MKKMKNPPNTKCPPDFKTSAERDTWVIANADYFTIIRRQNLANERIEKPTLAKARAAAKDMLTMNPRAHLLIYAVCNIYSAYVETVQNDHRSTPVYEP
jgi:hypothetical protein